MTTKGTYATTTAIVTGLWNTSITFQTRDLSLAFTKSLRHFFIYKVKLNSRSLSWETIIAT